VPVAQRRVLGTKEFMPDFDASFKIYRPSTKLIYLDIIISALAVACVGLPVSFLLAILFNSEAFVTRFFPGVGCALFAGLYLARGTKFFRSITISNTAISGAKPLSYGRTGFFLKDINIRKSQKRSLFLRVFGSQIIFSNDGEKILFYRRIFSDQDIREILTRCNLMT
jgi:hypothetical protein